MKEVEITRSCMIEYDANGKVRIIELEDIPPDEDPFKNMDTCPSKESIERARVMWEQYQRMKRQSESGDAA